jgi:hypothetical protein
LRQHLSSLQIHPAQFSIFRPLQFSLLQFSGVFGKTRALAHTLGKG